MRKSLKPSGPPEAVQAINKTIGLLRATLRRAKPRAIPRSLRSQTVGLVRHWLNWRLRGQTEIYPGMEKMAEWGECKEWQARENTRTLEAWLAVRPTAYAKGGRRATRFVLSGEGLFRALVDLGCNPSPTLRNGLRQYDLMPALPPEAENPVVSGGIAVSFQSIMENQNPVKNRDVRVILPVENPVVACYENPVKNPVVTTAGILTLLERPAICAAGRKEEPLPVLDLAPLDQRRKDAGERSALAEASATEANPLPSFTSEKNTHSEPKGERASQLAGAASLPDLDADRPRLSPDAMALLDHLKLVETSTYGAFASATGIGATRAWRAEAELLAAGAARHNTQGRMIATEQAAVPRGVVLPFALGARANATTPKIEVFPTAMKGQP